MRNDFGYFAFFNPIFPPPLFYNEIPYLCQLMNKHFKSIILQQTGASALAEKELIQELWSGYGKIMRVELQDASVDSVVVKHVQLPTQQNHPRGWDTDIGHQRKVKSYQVETTWYQRYSKYSKARLPQCFAVEMHNEEVLMVLEDLNAVGFPLRKYSVSWKEIAACLEWLAKFHASYLGKFLVDFGKSERIGIWKLDRMNWKF